MHTRSSVKYHAYGHGYCKTSSFIRNSQYRDDTIRTSEGSIPPTRAHVYVGQGCFPSSQCLAICNLAQNNECFQSRKPNRTWRCAFDDTGLWWTQIWHVNLPVGVLPRSWTIKTMRRGTEVLIPRWITGRMPPESALDLARIMEFWFKTQEYSSLDYIRRQERVANSP
jgi:hypothetical protein